MFILQINIFKGVYFVNYLLREKYTIFWLGKKLVLESETGEIKCHGRRQVAPMESAPVDYMLFPNFDDWTIHARPANAMYVWNNHFS